MSKKAVIFLTFANDHKGQFLEALRPEQDGINYELIPVQNEKRGIVYNSSASSSEGILKDLNGFSRQIAIFHFSGHSDGKNLRLESNAPGQIYLDGDNLTQLLIGEAKENLKLVFLNACLTKGMLPAFQKIGVPIVIATSAKIPDEKAKKFAIAFYRSLVSGNTVETAFIQGKTLIDEKDRDNRVYSFRGFEREKTNDSESFWGLYIKEDEMRNWRLSDIVGDMEMENRSQNNKLIENKNTVTNSSIQAGGNVTIGDSIQTESRTSQIIRILLFVLVPLLAIGGAYLWYQNQVLQKPFSFKVQLQDLSNNDYLPKVEGKITWIDKESSQSKTSINQIVSFEGRNPKYRKDSVQILFEARGFESINMNIIPEDDLLLLPIKRDDTYAHMQGIIYEFDSDPPEGLEGVIVSIPCCTDTTDVQGNFSFTIPLAEQRVEHRMELYKSGFKLKSLTEPVVKGNTIRNYLEKK
ncbi:MAG: CHAT domain-containing protein [Bacteroidota bacterium]